MIAARRAAADARGYRSALYAASLAAFGEPLALPRSGGWLLRRPIPGSPAFDAMGCYPLFCCSEWSQLEHDLDDLDGIVSVAAVADPFGNYQESQLKACFPAIRRPFKSHAIVDLATEPTTFVSKHHQREARLAQRAVEVLECDPALAWLDEWTSLYAKLISRHGITGLRSFSRSSFAQQLEVPGVRAWRAEAGGEVVAMTLWFVDGDHGYYHLAASSPRGYDLSASYALLWHILTQLRSEGLRRVSLGAGAGLDSDGEGGLARFKLGWANRSIPGLFCGRINDSNAYHELTHDKGSLQSEYFPAYREGEFG